MSYELDPGAAQRTLLAVERNQLAAERTFLSWIRTGIACIGGGIALERLLAFQTPSHQLIAYIIAILLILLGAGIFIGALMEFEKAYQHFKKRNPKAYVAMSWRRIVVIVLCIVAILFLYLTY